MMKTTLYRIACLAMAACIATTTECYKRTIQNQSNGDVNVTLFGYTKNPDEDNDFDYLNVTPGQTMISDSNRPLYVVSVWGNSRGYRVILPDTHRTKDIIIKVGEGNDPQKVIVEEMKSGKKVAAKIDVIQ